MNPIVTILQAHKAELFRKYPLKSIALFGSYSRNEQTENSDIDVMVELSGPIGIRFITLSHELEDLLKKKMDLVSRRGIKSPYFEHIKSDLIYV